jgi:hypothetical protein
MTSIQKTDGKNTIARILGEILDNKIKLSQIMFPGKLRTSQKIPNTKKTEKIFKKITTIFNVLS